MVSYSEMTGGRIRGGGFSRENELREEAIGCGEGSYVYFMPRG